MANEINASIDSVLAQMRQMRAQASNELAVLQAGQDRAVTAVAQSAESPGFGGVLGDALARINDLQLASGEQSTAYASGASNDLVGTMIASQKANLGFQALVATRNRVVSAYQDIMKMPI